jgi:glutathione synthase/RimK-type ligase-like ATP-grasp enzyme
MAFLRSFMLLSSAKWVNHPQSTFLAETKAVQLAKAADLGFRVPQTLITNHFPSADVAPFLDDNLVAVKAIEAVLIEDKGAQTFGFTSLISPEVVATSYLRSAPVMLQEALEPKTDVRVTVVGQKVYAVAISLAGSPVPGDWRALKDRVTYERHELPRELEEACCRLVRSLGLVFGAIDLVMVGDTYFFLEINPTGEWSWLVERAGVPIDDAIAAELAGIP